MTTAERGEIWAVCESRDGRVLGPGFELVGKARELADAGNARVGAVLFGLDLRPEADRLIAAGADVVYLVPTEPGCPDDGMLARGLAEAAGLRRPEAVLVPASIRGRSLAPQAAALLRTGLTADCTGLHIGPDGLLVQTRPAFGSSLMARIVCAAARPQMATVRPGVFPAPAPDGGRRGEIVELPAVDASGAPSPEYVGCELIKAGGAGLAAADIVLAGGMGLGSADAFGRLERLARAMGACPAASRAAVHAGYAPYSRQVGQTGVTVRPRLYIALGISGAVQHLAGMSGADCVVAVNSDPKAPIFRVADHGLVADAGAALEALSQEFPS